MTERWLFLCNNNINSFCCELTLLLVSTKEQQLLLLLQKYKEMKTFLRAAAFLRTRSRQTLAQHSSLRQPVRLQSFGFPLSTKTLNILLWLPVLIVIHDHVLGLVRISGRSMQPTLNPDSSCMKQDIVLVNKLLGDKGTSLKRDDIITFRHPHVPSSLLTKRIVGLEGDVVRRDPPVMGAGPSLVRVPLGHCWVEGDEPFHSEDSNRFGPVSSAHS